MNDHILSTFDKALANLRETTIQMGAGARRNLDNAMRGLFERDTELCNNAIVDDEEEDQLEIEVDRMGMKLITQFQPLVGDLRIVISSMKTASNLERISDQAVSIAKRARKILKNDEITEQRSIESLYQYVASMLEDALVAYADVDMIQASSVLEREKQLKKLNKKISRAFTKALEGKSDQYRDYLDLVFICRWLERAGSLAVNIAEDVIFEETSVDVRHGGGLPTELQNE